MNAHVPQNSFVKFYPTPHGGPAGGAFGRGVGREAQASRMESVPLERGRRGSVRPFPRLRTQ